MANKEQEIHFRLNFGDKQLLEELALKEDLSLSHFMRRIVRNYLKGQRAKTGVPEEVTANKLAESANMLAKSAKMIGRKSKRRPKRRARKKPIVRVAFG